MPPETTQIYESSGEQDRPFEDFLKQYCEDEDAGTVRLLRDYLKLFPNLDGSPSQADSLGRASGCASSVRTRAATILGRR